MTLRDQVFEVTARRLKAQEEVQRCDAELDRLLSVVRTKLPPVLRARIGRPPGKHGQQMKIVRALKKMGPTKREELRKVRGVDIKNLNARLDRMVKNGVVGNSNGIFVLKNGVNAHP